MVYGDTGLGKTAVTKHIMELTIDEAENNGNMLSVIIEDCNNDSAFSYTREIVNQLRDDDEKDFPKCGLSTADAMDALYEELNKLEGTVILVADEIDHMDGVDSFLSEMSRAESTGDLNEVKLGIVGISNDYSFRSTLSAKTSGPFAEHELNFGPYDAEDLRHILEERAVDAFRDGTVDEAVIPKCAALAARDKGDSR